MAEEPRSVSPELEAAWAAWWDAASEEDEAATNRRLADAIAEEIQPKGVA